MRVAIFGGTFNPIHIGHLELAKTVRKGMKIDRFFFVPASRPPHKESVGVGCDHRYRMTKIAVEKLGDEFEVSDCEITGTGKSYTYLTLEKFRSDFKDAELFFICGSDIFATIETWTEWRYLFDLANFLIVNRSDLPFDEMMKEIPEELHSRVVTKREFAGEKAGRIVLFEMPEVDMSSTFIREKLGEIEPGEATIEEVHDYIIDKNLYEES